MFEVVLYENRKGESQIRDYIDNITQSNSKDSHIKFKRFNNCIVYLKMDGTRAGLPHVKHLDGEIWELRPGDDRVLQRLTFETPKISDISIASSASSSARTSSAVNATSAAPRFSSNRLRLRVPGIGTIHGFLQIIHASEI